MWLRAEVRARRSWAGQGGLAADDPVQVASGEGRLLALERVGALTPEEAERWRRELDVAARWRNLPGEPLPAGVRVAAERHLDELVAQLSPADDSASPACFSAVWAYQRTGVLNDEDALGWRERIRERLGLEPERPPVCSRRDLVRVVLGPAVRRDGLRITTAELYADGVVLYWHHVLALERGPLTPRRLHDGELSRAGDYDDTLFPTLRDDRGTRYLGGGGPTLGIRSAGHRVLFGVSSFTPAVPDQARRLTVPLPGGDLDVEL